MLLLCFCSETKHKVCCCASFKCLWWRLVVDRFYKTNLYQKECLSKIQLSLSKKILINEVIIIFVGCPKNKHFSPLIDLSPNFSPKPLFPQNRSN